MGVKGIWNLLGATGRKAEVQCLGNKAVAVDASIWIVQVRVRDAPSSSSPPLQNSTNPVEPSWTMRLLPLSWEGEDGRADCDEILVVWPCGSAWCAWLEDSERNTPASSGFLSQHHSKKVCAHVYSLA